TLFRSIRTGAEVTGIATDGVTAEVAFADGGTVEAADVLVNASPHALAALLGERPPAPAPEGAQLKVNMLLRRLPRLRDTAVDPRDAFAGTFHVAEGYTALQRAYEQAAAGRVPDAPLSEIYCHSLTDPSILSPELAGQGAHTLTLFGLHAPARLFAGDPAGTKDALLRATLAQLDAVLAEPLADCLAADADGRPCIEAKSPPDLEREVGLPGGHIFHRDLSWPYSGGHGDVTGATGRWGVGTGYANLYVCGAGAVRGGGVSGVPGHNAAMAVLEKAR
ncbi:MAG: FAD-dependent oxidoreductase, partial [Streptomyces sp.]|nr:FAD-dependent oxidoreductase [Streptomyces sp.]